MSEYTMKELEQAFHDYYKAKNRFLRIAKRFCEQQGVDESHNMGVIEPNKSRLPEP